MKPYVLVLILLCSSSALALNNFISCGTSAGFAFRCSIPSKTLLLPRQSVKSDYSLSYQLTCNRNYAVPVASKIKVLLADAEKITLNYNDKKENILVGTGTGELNLVDTLPQELWSKKYEECSLKIWDVKAVPASDTIAAWKTEKANLESQIVLATAARDANTTLALLEPAVEVYGRFVDAVLSERQSEAELKDAINGLKSCANENDDPAICEQTIEKITSATDLFTEEEQDRLASLQKLLSRISFDSISCPVDSDCSKTILKKYLTPDDLAELEQVKAKLAETKGAGEKVAIFGKRVETLTQQLNDLKAKSGSSIQW